MKHYFWVLNLGILFYLADAGRLTGEENEHLLHRIKELPADRMKLILDKMLDNFINTTMKSGDQPLSLPILDPLRIENLHFKNSNSFFSLTGHAEKTVISGLSNCTRGITVLEPDIAKYSFNLACELIRVNYSGKTNYRLPLEIPINIRDAGVVDMKGVSINGTLFYDVVSKLNNFIMQEIDVDLLGFKPVLRESQHRLVRLFGSYIQTTRGLTYSLGFLTRNITWQLENGITKKFQNNFFHEVYEQVW